MFDVGLLQARGVMVMFMLLTVATLYLFAYRVWGFRVAFPATLLVATFAPFYGNGKNVLGEVPGLFFFFLLLYFLSKVSIYNLQFTISETPTLKIGNWKLNISARYYWIGAGLAAGMFMATKPNFILLLPVLGIVLLLFRKRIGLDWKNALYGIVSLSIPVALNLLLQFGLSSSLINGLASYANPPGIISDAPLFTHILRNAFLFVQHPAPAYLLATMLVWISYIVLRYRRHASIPVHEWIALGFAAVTIAYFLKMQGSFRYFFVAQVIAFSYAVAACLAFFSTRMRRAILAAGFVLLLAFQIDQVLFRSWVAGYYHVTRSAELKAYLGSLDPSTHVFFYDAVEAVTFFSSENYSQYFPIAYYNDAFGKNQLASLKDGVPDVVVMEASLEQGARDLLAHYEKRMTIGEGYYSVFERK